MPPKKQETPKANTKRKATSRKTKLAYKATKMRKIPETILKETLKRVQDPSDPAWADFNRSCTSVMHLATKYEHRISIQTVKLRYAQQCLLRRDWRNLAKVLSLCTFDAELDIRNLALPVFTKYAAICLAHNDKALLDTFAKAVIDSGFDSATLMKMCTTFSGNKN